ncbi:helix-turn-helix domain-containing protein, partial [Thomasclavelia cocleata]
MGVGIRLKNILDEKNITLKDLSLISGVSLNTLYGITKRDNDTIKSDILTKIAGSLNVPPQYILGLDG